MNRRTFIGRTAAFIAGIIGLKTAATSSATVSPHWVGEGDAPPTPDVKWTRLDGLTEGQVTAICRARGVVPAGELVECYIQAAGKPDEIFAPNGGGFGEYEAQRVRSAMRQPFSNAGAGSVIVSPFPSELKIIPFPWNYKLCAKLSGLEDRGRLVILASCCQCKDLPAVLAAEVEGARRAQIRRIAKELGWA